MTFGSKCMQAGAAALLAAALTPALAADAPEDDRYSLSLGAYFVSRTNGTIRLDRTVGGIVTIGTSIDWERDLGGETSMTVPRLDGYFRFAPKHRMDFSWYKIDRGGLIVSQRGLDFGDVTFPPGSTLDSELNTETLKATYTYSFYRAPEIETSLSVGLHVTRMDASVRSSGGGLAESNSVTAPLPVFGFRLDYAFTPKWWMRSKYELFFLDSADEYQGALSDFTIAVEHHTFKHVGFGFGLNRSSLDIEVQDPDQRGAFSSVLNGLMLYVTVR
ncbi:MAG: hypothetical protein OEW94_07780 [Betaproteobacteria bacterium]|nr:hypothetical protein [Betaproteobacteria bacterium]MDH5350252.1 hypothetical protein [Betaproteobacteria bacterium]